MNQHTQMKEHIIANSFDMKLPGDMPGERGSGTFMLNDFFVVFFFYKSIFASFPQPRTRQRKKTKLNKETRST